MVFCLLVLNWAFRKKIVFLSLDWSNFNSVITVRKLTFSVDSKNWIMLMNFVID